MSADNSQIADHVELDEPELLFHPDRAQETEVHPLRGLLRFGPYSRSLLQSVVDPIRIGIIAPFGGAAVVQRLLEELGRQQFPKERKAYLQEFPGFTRVFRVNVVPAASSAVFEFPKVFDEQLKQARAPYVLLAESLSRALSTVAACRLNLMSLQYISLTVGVRVFTAPKKMISIFTTT